MTGKNILQLFASSYTSRSNVSNSFPIIESFTSHIFLLSHRIIKKRVLDNCGQQERTAKEKFFKDSIEKTAGYKEL